MFDEKKEYQASATTISSYSVIPCSPRELMLICSLSTYSETTTYEMMENHQQTKSQETIGEGNH